MTGAFKKYMMWCYQCRKYVKGDNLPILLPPSFCFKLIPFQPFPFFYNICFLNAELLLKFSFHFHKIQNSDIACIFIYIHVNFFVLFKKKFPICFINAKILPVKIIFFLNPSHFWKTKDCQIFLLKTISIFIKKIPISCIQLRQRDIF